MGSGVESVASGAVEAGFCSSLGTEGVGFSSAIEGGAVSSSGIAGPASSSNAGTLQGPTLGLGVGCSVAVWTDDAG